MAKKIARARSTRESSAPSLCLTAASVGESTEVPSRKVKIDVTSVVTKVITDPLFLLSTPLDSIADTITFPFPHVPPPAC